MLCKSCAMRVKDYYSPFPPSSIPSEIGCWPDLVRYCVYRIEESIDETLLEDLNEDSAVVH